MRLGIDSLYHVGKSTYILLEIPSSVSIFLGKSRAPFVSRVCVFETRFLGALIVSVLLSTGSGLTTGKTIGFFTIGLRDKVHVDFLTKTPQSARG